MMVFQSINEQLERTRSWYILLTGSRAELKTKARLEDKGIITYLPLASVRRQWGSKTKEIRIPVLARCVFIYASDEEIETLQNQAPILRVTDVFNEHQDHQ